MLAAQRVAELATEKVGLMSRLDQIDAELNTLIGGGTKPTPKPAPKVEPKSEKPKKKAKVHPRVKIPILPPPHSMGAQARGPGRPTQDSTVPPLSALLTSIAQHKKKTLTHAEFVQLSREAGYDTKSDNYSGMVYQSLMKLVDKGVLSKNQDRTFEYMGNAA